MRDDGDKKFKVYVKDPKTGNVITVRFGDPNMEIKRDSPERRSSFRARHKCSEQKDVTSAAYWSCKMWEKSSSVSDNINKSNWEVWLEKDDPCWEGYEQYGMKDKDGKQVPNCVKKTGGGDLLSVMEGDKPENYKAVEAGRQRGRAIDKTEPTGLSEEQLKKWRSIQEDDKEDSDNQYYNKFMEKKEMKDAVEELPKKKDIEKTIEILEKAGYQVYTEDRNNGTGINDTEREIPEKKLPIKGSLSQELPRGIQQANLNESQTFEQKVQALIREGKSRESAEKIVGSFVHKVEASSGSGGAGIGDASNSNGGTLTTGTGGANNPGHNNGCDCTLKDCKRNDKCNCCKKCKNHSKGLDISNTNAGGVMESAYNQDAPNAQRLNNKATEKEGYMDSYDEGADDVRSNISTDAPNIASKLFTKKPYKAKALRELNKVHALMKLNAIKKLHISGGLGSRGLGTDHGHTQGSGDSTQVTLVQPRPEDDRVSSKRTTKEPKE